MAMRFRAHETFFIRKGWLSKGMEHVKKKPDVFVDKNENPMDVLGIGTNMVKSLRYWLQVVGLTQEPKSGKRIQKLTEFGKMVYENDKYLEEMGTLQLLQYHLASQKEDATSWYFFFNEFSMSEFTKEEFVRLLQNYILMSENDSGVAIRSLNDDFSCIVNTYLPRYKLGGGKVSAENNLDCPLGELGLVDFVNKREKIYKKSIPSAKSFNPWVILAIIVKESKGRMEIALNELLTAPQSIGKIFNLDAITMLDILHEIETIGKIKIIRTAGLDVIRLNESMTFEECVETYYKKINEGV